MARIFHYVKQVLFYSFLILYILLLGKALLFKDVSLFELFKADRTVIRAVNLVPFQTILNYFYNANINLWISFMNVAGNVILFIPLGMYMQIFRRSKRIVNCTALVCAVSLFVEAIQYALGIGRTDIDDVILNTLGGLMGILIYRILYLLLKDEYKIRSAVTFLYCLIGVCFGLWYFVMVHILGYRIKIF